MKLCTIGFTNKTAEAFFERLRQSGAQRVVDVRLNNVSQLAGFSKREDLRYFLKALLGIEYVHLPLLAPTPELLESFKKRLISWDEYERAFLALLREREIERQVPREVILGSCLLCSEDKPHRCHRRLVAERLREAWGDVDIQHL